MTRYTILNMNVDVKRVVCKKFDLLLITLEYIQAN